MWARPLVLASLLFASAASADVVDEEIEQADCESGRALVVDHGRTECLEPSRPAESGCDASAGYSSGGSTGARALGGTALIAFAALGLVRRRVG